ncbi:MAG: nucleoside triphosphate pyrophosphohydrolase [Candidatus Absconditabacteria bacterium]
MLKVKYDKLIRDHIDDLATQDGAKLDAEYIDGDRKVTALITKIGEESDELLNALSREDKISELGDLQEIIDALCETLGISKDELIAAQTAKRAKKGGFSKGLYAHTMTVGEDHPRYQYFKENPDKYPEIE